VSHYSNGRVVRHGVGLSFLLCASGLYRRRAIGSADVPFIFNEMTADFQAITIQAS